uniref:Uncharacterized protein n=2 Tax=Anopheles stephensi TaxID=30069 RepID=A0A182YM41_ANOST
MVCGSSLLSLKSFVSMVHPERVLLLVLVLSVASNYWSPVAAFDDFLEDIFSIFFDSDSESDSSEPIQVNGKNATINVECDNCTLTINCPNCNSMATVAGGTMMTVTASPPPAPPTPNGDSATPPAASAPAAATIAPGSATANETTTAGAAGATTAVAPGDGAAASTDAPAPDAPPSAIF